MPKATSNKKVVASAGGRKISTPVGLLFIVGGALLLTVAGTYGYTKYKERDLKAKATAWKEIKPFSATIGSGDGVKFVGCRQYLTNGPDSQQNKPVKVYILASKPKGLQGPDGKAATFGVRITPKEDAQAIYGNRISMTWWNNELSQLAETVDLRGGKITTSHKISVYVRSAQGLGGPGSYPYNPSVTVEQTISDAKKYKEKAINPANIKRVYWTAPNLKSTDPQYKKAWKTFNTQTISVAKLPNCN